ncbi:unnamed protein product [Prunus armeniaca]|uniref:Uncharacterized protein n=1 Tax=Prunus armeniaca TaxID=36596 RepID=A0A6J5WT09_PRUAR|nr:unnamed protein product [Prunus armeniaca]
MGAHLGPICQEHAVFASSYALARAVDGCRARLTYDLLFVRRLALCGPSRPFFRSARSSLLISPFPWSRPDLDSCASFLLFLSLSVPSFISVSTCPSGASSCTSPHSSALLLPFRPTSQARSFDALFTKSGFQSSPFAYCFVLSSPPPVFTVGQNSTARRVAAFLQQPDLRPTLRLGACDRAGTRALTLRRAPPTPFDFGSGPSRLLRYLLLTLPSVSSSSSHIVGPYLVQAGLPSRSRRPLFHRRSCTVSFPRVIDMLKFPRCTPPESWVCRCTASSRAEAPRQFFLSPLDDGRWDVPAFHHRPGTRRFSPTTSILSCVRAFSLAGLSAFYA